MLIGISEGAVGCQPMCVSSWWFFGAAGAAAPGVVLVAGRAGKGGGVKVERPQPKARTNDLDATAGRRRLFSDDVGSAQLGCRPAGGAGVRIGFLGVEVAEVGRVGCQASLRSAVGP